MFLGLSFSKNMPIAKMAVWILQQVKDLGIFYAHCVHIFEKNGLSYKNL